MKRIVYLFLFFPLFIDASPTTVSPHLKVDQFGYRESAVKVCVIADPVNGYDNGSSFTPGTNYEVRRWSDDVSVFSGTPTAWNNGNIHDQSGDRVWWFDFSNLITPGDYYVYDVNNQVGSVRFSIDNGVYDEVLRQAVRTFFYQRCGVAKPAVFGGVWHDDVACHLGPQQDLDCRLVTDINNPATSKDLSGGWHDAGDYNKYVNFTYNVIHPLLFAYRENPEVFTDDFNIPESSNGIPDLLDEVKVELDWLMKMQLDDGSVLMKVSITDYSGGSPPSAHTGYRRYGEAAASATRSFCSMAAHAAVVYRSLGMPATDIYSDTLESRALRAWDWMVANPDTSGYDNAGFWTADPEVSSEEQEERRLASCVFLYELTGDNQYRNIFDQGYEDIRVYRWYYWFTFMKTIQDVMLHYTTLAGATPTVVSNIHNNFTFSSTSNNPFIVDAWNSEKDAFRAYMGDTEYTWGSNSSKASSGDILMNMVKHNLDPTNRAKYEQAAEGFIHYLHGVNPTRYCYLSNMSDYGAENSIDEIYHGWFDDGTDYDNASTSLYGPAPGFISGGPNPNFQPDPTCACTISPPQNQPIQKSYKDWNADYPENSWEVTEPAIYYQAAYIRLLAHFAVGMVPLPAELSDFSARPLNDKRVQLDWTSQSEQQLDRYALEHSTDGIQFREFDVEKARNVATQISSYSAIHSQPVSGTNYYRLRMVDLDGSHQYSNVKTVYLNPGFSLDVFPNPSRGNFVLHIRHDADVQSVDYRLRTSDGRIIREGAIAVGSDVTQQSFNQEELAPGVYFLWVQVDSRVFEKKVVIW